MIREWHRPLTPDAEQRADEAARVLIEKGILREDDPKDVAALTAASTSPHRAGADTLPSEVHPSAPR